MHCLWLVSHSTTEEPLGQDKTKVLHKTSFEQCIIIIKNIFFLTLTYYIKFKMSKWEEILCNDFNRCKLPRLTRLASLNTEYNSFSYLQESSPTRPLSNMSTRRPGVATRRWQPRSSSFSWPPMSAPPYTTQGRTYDLYENCKGKEHYLSTWPLSISHVKSCAFQVNSDNIFLSLHHVENYFIFSKEALAWQDC